MLRLDRQQEVVCVIHDADMTFRHANCIVSKAAELFEVPRLSFVLPPVYKSRACKPQGHKLPAEKLGAEKSEVSALGAGALGATDDANPPEATSLDAPPDTTIAGPTQLMDWLARVAQARVALAGVAQAGKDVVGESVCYVSPPLKNWGLLKSHFQADPGIVTSGRFDLDVLDAAEPESHGGIAEAIPLRDRLLMLVAQRICVLAVRESGHVDQLIEQHLADPERCNTLVHIRAEPSEKTRAGTVPWYLFPSSEPLVAGMDGVLQGAGCPADLADHWQSIADGQPTAGAVDDPLTQPERWLLHWTRSRKGPWPEQSSDGWLEELILGCVSANRSALAVLLRILSEKRIRCSKDAIRGGYPVVALTEVPLADFRRNRRFRRHRGRYDFEPWGIAVRKSRLLSLGAKPVIYGDDQTWHAIPEDDRPWFQKHDPSHELDGFQVEREWRVRGDIDLSKLAAADVVVFVDTLQAAAFLQSCTEYQTLVVPQ